MDRVLVTGGAGYIGSHCCKALAEAGFEPVVFDNFATGHASFVRWGPTVEGDVRDGEAIEAALKEYRPVGVMHFAAVSLVGESVRNPGPYYDVNVGGTLRIAEAMRKLDITAFVFSSTCAVYGEPETVPISEAAGFHPVSPYGASKLACERMLDDFDAAYSLRSVRLRYFNAAGADPASVIGEWHEPETHLIPLVIDAALGRREEVGIFGTDYATDDGTAVRDYIHVTDLASAHLGALKYLLDGGKTQAINVGTGRGASVAEVIRTVETVTGRRVPSRNAPRRAGDPPRLVADPSRARSVLGWRAEHDLATIVDDAWRWHRGRNVA